MSILKYTKKYKKQLILGPVFKFLEAVFELFLPLLMAAMVDQGIQKNNWNKVLELTLGMFVLSLLGLIAAVICQYYASRASQGFGTEVRNALMAKINKLSYRELDKFGSDTLITRMTNDVNQVQLALAMFIRLLIRAPFLSIGSVIMAFYIDFQMGLIFLALLPIFCLILFLITLKSVPLYSRVQKRLDGINRLVSQNLSGVRVIRAFARRASEEEEFDQASDSLADISLKVSNLSALLTPMTTLIMNLGIVGIFYLGGFKVNLGHLEQGQILALVNYMNQMLLALITVSYLVVIFTRAYASAKRIDQILLTPVSIDREHEGGLSRDGGRIDFKNVDFKFSDDSGLSLRDINFSIDSGKTLGIIGPTGSGKTILSQLIPRFYDASAGVVEVNGLDVREWNLKKLRGIMALVPQKSVLFSGTVKDNLLLGREDASEADCWEALRLAQADDFIKNLPQGLMTEIFEGGKNFSGGQKQRLTIARALVRKPKILILDDSLSALDYQTDYNLRQALKEINCTIIIISQRLKSIEGAHEILVMDSGKLVGRGVHKDLLKNCALYKEIVNSQEEGQDDD
ncbi:ABC transporter ATP-binding protein [Streptococcaceae bacterium ESL0729]|nr:ABC transporter ATP-binding protein [Streptococcaceae bacterium ESL0729]